MDPRVRVPRLAIAWVLLALAVTGCGAPRENISDVPAIAVLKVGQSAVNDGLKATLKSTGDGPGDLDGQSTFMIVVTYENVGTEPASFFIRDWQVEDESGVRARLVGDVNLGIGEVAPGATLAGTVYFSSDTKAARVVYEPTPGHALAVWNLH